MNDRIFLLEMSIIRAESNMRWILFVEDPMTNVQKKHC